MNNLLAIVYGLAASLCWGSGDFCGGLSSRRANASNVVVTAYTVGLVLLVALALIKREPFPSLVDIIWGTLAGVVGVIALLAFYAALSRGRMGIAAPVSAVLTASIPVIFNIFTASLPGPLQLVGFALALLAIVLISRPERSEGRPAGIGLALLAGCGFGSFFILISRISPSEVFWPLAIARLTSVFFLLVVMALRKQRVAPKLDMLPLMSLAGTLDAIGNAFFVLAAHSGRLDVASVLSSLYPAATVLLAALILRERVTRIQAVGIAVALVAVPLISI